MVKKREKEDITIQQSARKGAQQNRKKTTKTRVVDLRVIAAQKQKEQEAKKGAERQKHKEQEETAFQKTASRFGALLQLKKAQHPNEEGQSRRKKNQQQKESVRQREEVPLILDALTKDFGGRFVAFEKETKKQWKKVKKSGDAARGRMSDRVGEMLHSVSMPFSGQSMTGMRASLGFLLVTFFLIVPATAFAVVTTVNTKEASMTAEAQQAFDQLQKGAESAQQVNFDQALVQFQEAQSLFGSLQNQIGGLTGVFISVAQYIPGKGDDIAAARDLVKAGNEVSNAAVSLAQAGKTASTLSVGSVLSQDNGVVGTLSQLHDSLEPAAQSLHEARLLVDGINANAVPESKREIFTQVKTQLPVLDHVMSQLSDLAGASTGLLAGGSERRYMIVFQNNRELRPTGGFMGSYAVITVRDGLVTSLDAPGGGIYDVAGQLNDRIVSPDPLHLVNPYWNIQDANWFPDFPTSAQKIQWFYERSNGGTLDGVIAFTPDVIEQLLKITGSIQLPESGLTVSSDNVRDILAERNTEYSTEDEPKKVISELTPVLLNALIKKSGDAQTALRIVLLLKQSLDQKNILVAVDDADVQSVFRQYNWDGAIEQVDGDYLYVNHANIAGGKTDQVVDEMIRHTAEVQDDGSIINHVEITRAHKGDPENPDENILNVSYVRAYVPEGSELLAASGFDMPLPNQFLQPDKNTVIDADLKNISGTIVEHTDTNVAVNTEFNKTVFGGWMRTSVGESTTVSLTYRIPQRISTSGFWKSFDSYALHVQKQPGMSAPFFVHNLVLPGAYEATAVYPEATETSTTAGEQPVSSTSQQVLLTDDYVTGAVIQSASK